MIFETEHQEEGEHDLILARLLPQPLGQGLSCARLLFHFLNGLRHLGALLLQVFDLACTRRARVLRRGSPSASPGYFNSTETSIGPLLVLQRLNLGIQPI